MMALADYLHDPEHIADALRHGELFWSMLEVWFHMVLSSLSEFIDLLLNAIHDENVIIRQKAAECFYLLASNHFYCYIISIKRLIPDILTTSIVSGHAIGRQAMIENEVIPSMTHLLDDPEPIVRLNAYKAIEITSEMSFGNYNLKSLVMVTSILNNEISTSCRCHLRSKIDCIVDKKNQLWAYRNEGNTVLFNVI